jgi:hypothetical protein
MRLPDAWRDWAGFTADLTAGLLSLTAAALLPILSIRTVRYLSARRREHQRETLHRIAAEAAALAEAAYASGDGPRKLALAIGYVQDQCSRNGIAVTTDIIRAAIEKAVMDYNAMVKPWSGISPPGVLVKPKEEGYSQ